jgi:hypothetical protein
MSCEIEIPRILIQRVGSGISVAELTDIFREICQIIAAGRYGPEGPSGHRLMALAVWHAERRAAGITAEETNYDLVLSLLSGHYGNSTGALRLIDADPGLRQAYQEIARECDPEQIGTIIPRLVLEKDGNAILEVPTVPPGTLHSLLNVTPGRYAISLDSGRLLWEQDLQDSHLLFRLAFPRKPVPLAAASGRDGSSPRCSLTISVLDGAVHVAIYPGLDAGRLELRIAGTTGGESHEA